MIHILVLEDDINLNQIVCTYLNDSGFQAKGCLSAKDDLPSKQKGFQLGIDDYMVKPIELDELLLRVRALLRRANIEMERKITVGNLELDADGMSATIDGEEINLTAREFNIIYELLRMYFGLFGNYYFFMTDISMNQCYTRLMDIKRIVKNLLHYHSIRQTKSGIVQSY